MRTLLIILNTLIIATASWAQAATLPSLVDPTAARRWHFKVLLDGKPIGYHEFAVTQEARAMEVHGTAHFKVSVMLVPLYHYDHDDRETWNDGCLAQIDANTNDNGKELDVRGRASGGKFELTAPAAATDSADCVRTFAYWDRSLLAAPRLLNSETGEYTPVSLLQRGAEHILVNNSPREAEHYSLRTGKFAIELWYSREGDWLALQTLTAGGRTLRYELQ